MNWEQIARNLLARIHRDGGHYTEKHGDEKAIEDAHKIVAQLYNPDYEHPMVRVRAFHDKFRCMVGDPRAPDVDVDLQLRYDLICEEFEELSKALILDRDQLSPRERLIAVADALGDMLYVIYGAAITWGIPLDHVFEAIHASNMTKEGGGTREDGKILKGPNYKPPNIAAELDFHIYE